MNKAVQAKKKPKAFALVALCMALAIGGAMALTGCGSNDSNSDNADTTELSGTVSTNGSTSMEKVIGSLSEAFMADNPNVSIILIILFVTVSLSPTNITPSSAIPSRYWS